MKNGLFCMRGESVFGFIFAVFLFMPFFVMAAPEVAILIPTDDANISVGAEVEFRIVAQNFLFVDYKNNSELYPGNPDAGQAVFWLDPEDEFVLESGNKMLSEDVVNLGVLPQGQHKIVVELLRNDLSRLDPPIRAETNFSVGEQKRDSYVDGIFILIALLSLVATLFLLFRRAYRRFTRHSGGT